MSLLVYALSEYYTVRYCTYRLGSYFVSVWFGLVQFYIDDDALHGMDITIVLSELE